LRRPRDRLGGVEIGDTGLVELIGVGIRPAHERGSEQQKGKDWQ
jgi:hypothetical protein